MLYRYKTPFELKPGVWVFPPTADGKAQGHEFLERLQKKWGPPEYYYHFRDGGHVQAIRDHMQNDYFAVADIKSFFQSTTRSMAVKALIKVGFKYEDALHIATNSTVSLKQIGNKKFIPYGFVQSAFIATLCFEHSKLGGIVRKAAAKGITVSVYMDDIILSCREETNDLLHQIFEEILEVMSSAPYLSNADKTQQPGKSIRVFNTEVSNGYVEILDKRMDKFKAALDMPTSDDQIEGIIRYVDGLNANQANELELYISD